MTARMRSGFVLLVFATALAGAGPAEAQDACASLPTGPVRWIVSSKVGGGYDAYSRLIEPHLEEALGREVIVDNVPGAGGRVGAAKIRDAEPDGLTLGLINGPGLLLAALTEGEGSINPATDFTILGRVAQSQQVWATRKESGIRSVEDIYRRPADRKIVFGTRSVGSLSFANGVLGSHLISAPVHFLPGYEGSGEGILGALRGESDLIGYDFGTLVSHLESGDLRPLLQMAAEPISDHPVLHGVPLLGGPGGEADRRSAIRGVTAAEAIADAEAQIALVGAGRLVVGPPSLPDWGYACLEQAMHRVLHQPAFVASAKRAQRSLDPARGDEARAVVQRAADGAGRFVSVLRKAIDEVRR